jgi:hypothetical protein
MQRFQAEQSGTMSIFKVKCSGSSNVKVAIYADNSGEPGSRLGYNDLSRAVTSGWNSLSIPSTAVTSGTYYWLAVNADANIALRPQTPGSGTYRFRAEPFSTFSFPASAGSGFSSGSGYTTLLAGYSSGPTPLSITTATLPDGTVGIPYSQTLQATGGTGSYTWSITSGSLPAGLSLIPSSGLISGTPTTATTASFTVQVNDGSTTATKPLSITINPSQVKLIGANDIAGTGVHGGNYLVVQRFQAEQTGSMTIFKIKCATGGNVKVAIYDDSSGQPGNLRAAVDTSTPVIVGWNSINISSPPTITAGNYYWLAVNSDANIVLRPQTTGSGTYGYKAATYSTFSFPASAGSDFTSGSGYTTLLAGFSF